MCRVIPIRRRASAAASRGDEIARREEAASVSSALRVKEKRKTRVPGALSLSLVRATLAILVTASKIPPSPWP
jgi:hypothetical protein